MREAINVTDFFFSRQFNQKFVIMKLANSCSCNWANIAKKKKKKKIVEVTGSNCLVIEVSL